MEEFRLICGEDGRLIIPATLRKKMKLSPGDEVLLTYDDYSVYMVTMKQAVKEAQEILKQYNPANISLVRETSAEQVQNSE